MKKEYLMLIKTTDIEQFEPLGNMKLVCFEIDETKDKEFYLRLVKDMYLALTRKNNEKKEN